MRRSQIRRKPPTRQQAIRNSTLRPRSKKMAKKYRDERVPFVVAMLEKNPRCQADVQGVCKIWAVHIHEPLQRSAAGSITDPENAMAVCGDCHRYIHANIPESREKGWLVNSGI